jgi:hypothetical protein
MPVLSTPSFGPRTAITYVTVGLLVDVWTGVWFWAFGRPATNTGWFWLAGFFLTGVCLIVVGLLLGPLGRAARRAELPPGESFGAEVAIQRTAAATPHPIVPPAAGLAPPTVPATVISPAVMPAQPAVPVGS